MPSDHSLEAEYTKKLQQLKTDFEFFANVTSHDLRDPLRQAKIYSDELLPLLSGTNKHKLDAIKQCIDEVLNKIMILREFSYIINTTKSTQPVDLDKIIKDLLDQMHPQIKKYNAKVTVATMPTVPGHEKQLQKLFFHLIDNALKFKSKEHIPTININVAPEPGFWHFTVQDNGIGLNKVYRDLVFVLFQRLDNLAQDDSYGVGLAFAKKIVENHGGSIWYESDDATGSKFHFTLQQG